MPSKAYIKNMDEPGAMPIPCLFNPTEYTISKSNTWSPTRSVGKDVPDIEFAGGQNSTLQMELFFDTFEENRDVRTAYIDKLMALSLINPKKRNAKTQRGRPPIVLFQWGGSWTFKAVIESLTVRFTLFSEDGFPVRATANVTFKEAEDVKVQEGTNPTSYSRPGYRNREVGPRDTLAMIAYQEYGDAGAWRNIADANELDDPLAIHPGLVLAIPPL